MRRTNRSSEGVVLSEFQRVRRQQMVLPIAVEDVKSKVKLLKALIGHENVVQFYNAFEDDNYVYIVMELCEGGKLLDRILAKKDSRYTEKDVCLDCSGSSTLTVVDCSGSSTLTVVDDF